MTKNQALGVIRDVIDTIASLESLLRTRGHTRGAKLVDGCIQDLHRRHAEADAILKDQEAICGVPDFAWPLCPKHGCPGVATVRYDGPHGCDRAGWVASCSYCGLYTEDQWSPQEALRSFSRGGVDSDTKYT